MVIDATFWAAASFVIFVVLAFRPLKKLVLTALDGRSLQIKKELDEALRLKEEAELFLVSCQRRYKEVLEEAAEITAHAREESKRMAEEAHDVLEQALARRMELADQKIANYETAVIQEIRTYTVNKAVQAAQQVISQNMDQATSDTLIDEALVAIGKKLH
jgi:F-type H+-transporting ATPase subunit b